MDNFFDRCKLCPKYEQCVFADTTMSCAWDIIIRDGPEVIEKYQEEKKDAE